jgi:hypothetical protein
MTLEQFPEDEPRPTSGSLAYLAAKKMERTLPPEQMTIDELDLSEAQANGSVNEEQGTEVTDVRIRPEIAAVVAVRRITNELRSH